MDRLCLRLSITLCARNIRRLPRQWTLTGLVLLTLTLVLHAVRRQDMRWPPTSSSQLQPLTSILTTPRLAAPMVFMESGLNNLICSGLSSQRIANQSQLDTLKHLVNGFLLPGRQNNNRGVTKDCHALRLKYAFSRWPVTTQEEQFPLAFSFKLHKYPDMFERLLSVLWHPHNLYCVHVDSKTPPDVYWRIVNVTSCFPNVVLTQTRINVVHASITSLYADIECMKVALNSSVKWRYHINLCGQEFPLKTNLEMVQILTALNGTNDVENYPPNVPFINLSYKYKSAIHRGLNFPTNETKAPFPDSEVQIRKGSAYNCLQRRFLDWALRDETNLRFLAWLNDTWAPDELFWATLSFRPGAPGGPGLEIRHDKDAVLSKAVVWQWDKYKCAGKVVRSVCIFGALDLPWLMGRHELIANKFDSSVDNTVLDCLEAEFKRRAVAGYMEIESRSRSEGAGRWPLLSTLNWTLYRSLPQFSHA